MTRDAGANPQLDSKLPSFDDRHTMRYVRLLDAPVHRVWKAVTVADHLNVWFLPVSRVEAKLGGRCSFSYGQPGEASDDWVISAFEPLSLVQYERGPYAMRFELESIDATTRLTFLETVYPDFPKDNAELHFVPNTPWCPGIVLGYTGMLDGLCRFVLEDWHDERLQAESERLVALANARELNGFHRYDIHDDPEKAERLGRAIYQHIAGNCPAE